MTIMTKHGRPLLRIAGGQETPVERFDREMGEQFPSETAQLDRASAAFTAANAALIRPDGTPKYGAAEHEERVAALLVQLDTVGAAVQLAAEAAITKAQDALVKLDGADGWERLTESERQAASTRQPFIREDCETGRPDQIVRQARAALAAADKAAIYLWARGVRRRVDTAQDQGQRTDPALSAVLRDLEGTFSDPTKLREQRQGIERRIESAKYLTGKVRQARRAVDGSHERSLAEMRQRYSGSF